MFRYDEIAQAEARVAAARVRFAHERQRTSSTFARHIRSPEAHLAAGALGFAWGLRPACKDTQTRSSAPLAKLGSMAIKALLTHWLAGTVT